MFGLAYLALGCPTTLDIFSRPFWGWQIFAGANLFVAAINLLPHTLRTQLGAIPSDGLQVFNLIFRPKTMNAESRHVARFVLEARTCFEQQHGVGASEWVERGLAIYPDNYSLLCMRSGVLLNAGELHEAREVLTALLTKTTTPNYMHFAIKNDIAYVGALLGTEELLDEADRHLARKEAA